MFLANQTIETLAVSMLSIEAAGATHLADFSRPPFNYLHAFILTRRSFIGTAYGVFVRVSQFDFDSICQSRPFFTVYRSADVGGKTYFEFQLCWVL